MQFDYKHLRYTTESIFTLHEWDTTSLAKSIAIPRLYHMHCESRALPTKTREGGGLFELDPKVNYNRGQMVLENAQILEITKNRRQQPLLPGKW